MCCVEEGMFESVEFWCFEGGKAMSPGVSSCDSSRRPELMFRTPSKGAPAATPTDTPPLSARAPVTLAPVLLFQLSNVEGTVLACINLCVVQSKDHGQQC